MDALRWPTVRLVVAAALFLAWLGWLSFLVLTASHPIVLSRPQFLVSSLDLTAHVDQISGAEPRVTVQEVRWPGDERARALEGKTIPVGNLAEVDGWTGPGEYILPLMTDWQGHYTVTGTPPSPGFPRVGKPRIYPVTPETLAQLNAIVK
jgi:hypothetical protein